MPPNRPEAPTRRVPPSAVRALAFAAALALAGGAPAAQGTSSRPAAPLAGAPQPLFRANPARTGFVAEGPEPPLALRWKFKTREGLTEIESFPAVDDGLSGASVANGVVYVGGHDGRIYALDARTGRKRWEFATNGHVNSTPTPADGLLFVGSMDRYIYALRIAGGSLAWKFLTGLRSFRGMSYGGVRSSPVIRDGTVYVGG